MNQLNEPISFAHLRFKENNIGTIANEEGNFRLVYNETSTSQEFIVSAIGYKTTTILLKEGFNTIKLAKDIIQLQGVTLTPTDFGKELVKKAIKAIPNNYPQKGELHIGFFREITYWEKEEPIYIIESEIETIKSSYKTKTKKGETKLLEFRKYESEQLDSLNTRITAGAHHIFRFDVVARREACLSNPNIYSYKILDTIPQGDSRLFKVFFEKKNKVSGTLYIQDETYSIVKAEYEYEDFGWLNNLFEDTRKFYQFTTAYEKGADGLWRYKRSHYETAFEKNNDKILYLTSDYSTTNVVPNTKSIPYLEQLQFKDILLNTTKEYNPEFWNNYTIILPKKEYEDLFRNVPNKEKITQETEVAKTKKKPNSLIKILGRFSYDFLITTSFFKNKPYTINYNNADFNISEIRQAENSSSIGLWYSLNYEFSPTIHIGFAVEEPFSKSGSKSYNFVLLKDFNINPKGRPITISPNLTFGWQTINQFIGEFENSSEISIRGKAFDAQSINVSLSQKNFRVMPGIGLGIEKNRNLNFVVSLGYNFQYNEKPGVLFEENDGFFLSRKNVFVEDTREGVSISSSNNNIFINKLVINVGLVLGL